ncbi:MAG: STAS/SEC14 domain-containing protein [Rhodothermales bacterium]
MLTLLDAPDHVLACRLTGEISGEDARAVRDEIAAKLNRHERLGFYVEVEGLGGYTPEALLDHLGERITRPKHVHRFDRAAIVTPWAYLTKAAKRQRPPASGPVVVAFDRADRDEAMRWVAGEEPDAPPPSSTATSEERVTFSRRELLDAARTVFSKEGYAEASLADIARRARLRSQTLYSYFSGGKRELLLLTAEDVYDEVIRLAEQTLADPRLRDEAVGPQPFRVRFFVLVVALAFYTWHNRDVLRFLSREGHALGLDADPEIARTFEREQHDLVGVLIPHVEAAVASGELTAAPAAEVAAFLLDKASERLGRLFAAGQGMARENVPREAEALAAALYESVRR